MSIKFILLQSGHFTVNVNENFPLHRFSRCQSNFFLEKLHVSIKLSLCRFNRRQSDFFPEKLYVSIKLSLCTLSRRQSNFFLEKLYVSIKLSLGKFSRFQSNFFLEKLYVSIKLSLCTLSGCQSNVSYFKEVTLMKFSALKNRTCESVFSTLQKSTANEKLGIKVDCVAVGLAFLTSRQKDFYLEPYVFSQTFFVQIQYVSIKFFLPQSSHYNQPFLLWKTVRANQIFNSSEG